MEVSRISVKVTRNINKKAGFRDGPAFLFVHISNSYLVWGRFSYFLKMTRRYQLFFRFPSQPSGINPLFLDFELFSRDNSTEQV